MLFVFSCVLLLYHLKTLASFPSSYLLVTFELSWINPLTLALSCPPKAGTTMKETQATDSFSVSSPTAGRWLGLLRKEDQLWGTQNSGSVHIILHPFISSGYLWLGVRGVKIRYLSARLYSMTYYWYVYQRPGPVDIFITTTYHSLITWWGKRGNEVSHSTKGLFTRVKESQNDIKIMI